ncbi:MAG: secretin and TonB N-terminal domain-containing protein [Candidatus Omnitrophica bacterium]|nr:secretin and TonB N-terminal domain-containing protein [Candidatus Omnitrophota bacterium]
MRSQKIFKVVTSAVFLISALGWLCPKNIFAQAAGQQQQSQAKQTPAQGTDAAKSAEKTDEVNKNLTGSAPVMEIKRLESESPLYSIELRDVQLSDLFRVIAHDYNLNILMDQDVSGTITASFTNISLEEALDAIADMSNLSLEKKGNIVKVKPNLLSKTIVLRYIEAKKLLEASSSGQAGSGQAGSSQASSGQASSGQASEPTGVYSLLSTKGKILLGQQQNSLTVIDYPVNISKVEEFLRVIDHKMETRVFKLKYMKADEVVGMTTKTMTTTQTSTPTGTQVNTVTSTSTASGATNSTVK